MKQKLPILMAFAFFSFKSFSQQNDFVALEIIDTNSNVKTYQIKWPFPSGPKNVGGEKSFMNVVDTILSDNNIECPPKREKVSENIWRCGNGKKIRTSSAKLSKLFSKAWE